MSNRPPGGPPVTRPDREKEPNFECSQCGQRILWEMTGTVEFSFVVGCPGCGTEMDRLDALGEIEKAARHGVRGLNLRAEFERRFPR